MCSQNTTNAFHTISSKKYTTLHSSVCNSTLSLILTRNQHIVYSCRNIILGRKSKKKSKKKTVRILNYHITNMNNYFVRINYK